MSERKLTGRHVIIIVAIAFTMVLAANITFISLALGTFTGQVTEDPYARGLAYNDLLEEHAAQEALGWNAHVESETTDTITQVSIALTDINGFSVPGASVTVQFRRPTHEGQDSVITLMEEAPGLYTAGLTLAAAGVWDVRGRATRGDGERLDFEERIWVE